MTTLDAHTFIYFSTWLHEGFDCFSIRDRRDRRTKTSSTRILDLCFEHPLGLKGSVAWDIFIFGLWLRHPLGLKGNVEWDALASRWCLQTVTPVFSLAFCLLSSQFYSVPSASHFAPSDTMQCPQDWRCLALLVGSLRVFTVSTLGSS
jgi:hypothetical protein